MSMMINDKEICKQLVSWFENKLLANPNTQPLTLNFIKKYKPIYDKRIERTNSDENKLEDFKKKQENIEVAYFKKTNQSIN